MRLHSRPLRIVIVASIVIAALTGVDPASACSKYVDRCTGPTFRPNAWTSVPANSPGFTVSPVVHDGQNAILSAELRKDDGGPVDVVLTVAGDGTFTLTPKQELVPGAYRIAANVLQSTSCAAPADAGTSDASTDADAPDASTDADAPDASTDAGDGSSVTRVVRFEHDFFVVPSAPLPTTLGPIELEEGDAGASGDAVVSVKLTPELRAFLPLTSWTLEIDGVAVDLASTAPKGEAPRYLVRATCGGVLDCEPTIERGLHRVRVRADVAGSHQPLTTDGADIVSTCPHAASWDTVEHGPSDNRADDSGCSFGALIPKTPIAASGGLFAIALVAMRLRRHRRDSP